MTIGKQLNGFYAIWMELYLMEYLFTRNLLSCFMLTRMQIWLVIPMIMFPPALTSYVLARHPSHGPRRNKHELIGPTPRLNVLPSPIQYLKFDGFVLCYQNLALFYQMRMLFTVIMSVPPTCVSIPSSILA